MLARDRLNTMQAITQRRYGDAPEDVLRLERVPQPAIGDDEVLVRVHAAGVDRGTWHLMTGKPYLMRVMGFGFRGPKNAVAGLDLAGTVVAVGTEVTRFAVGDEVLGIGRGSFAEYAAAPEDKLVHKPAGLTFEHAAVVAVSGLTAIQAVRDAGRVRAGQTVLVIGASGGVGTFALQVAKADGAEVTGVARTSKLDLVRSIGADHVVDYTQEDFAGGDRRYDVIVDIGGNTRLSRLRRALTAEGTLVIVGGESGGNLTGGFGRQLRAVALSAFLRQRLTMLTAKEHHVPLQALTQLVESGRVTPVVDRTYPLADVAGALRHLTSGGARGKIAITI